MAGLELTVDMRDDDLLPAWQTVIEVAGTGISENFTLVGGLMAAAHGSRAGVMMRRSTDDMDALVECGSALAVAHRACVRMRERERILLKEN